jgi:hypothetical protein
MTIQGMVDAQPYQQPNETESSRKDECGAPSKGQCDQGNDQGSDGPAYTRAAIEDGYSEAAFLAGKPLGNCFAGAGPVESFPDSEQKSKGGKTKNGRGKAGENVDDGPEDDCQSEAEPRPYGVKKDATEQPGDRILDLERAQNSGEVGMCQMVLRGDQRR